MSGVIGGLVLVVLGMLLSGPEKEVDSKALVMIGGGLIGIGALFTGISIADLGGLL